jgi:hypothetical protein
MKKTIIILTALVVVLAACRPNAKPDEYNAKAANPEFYHQSVEKLTEVIIHDIFSPPVASRIYTYANLAGYEALVPAHANYQTLGGRLKGFKGVPKPEAGQEYCFPLASVEAFLSVARTLTFTAEYFDKYEATLFEKYKAMGIPSDVYERSMAYGDSVALHVMKYAAKDNYKQTRGFRYTVTNVAGTWVPTPPAYADAVEPLWNTIRSVTMDSAAQFKCPAPPAYTKDKKSLFFAYFWDDNAFVMNVAGHVMFANKKMTPGGHWLAMLATVARNKKLPLMQCVEGYALTSASLLDAFISCWDNKYRYIKLRPETAINSDIDPKWLPFLQTPPFPEYTSGHSTISAAAAEILSKVVGDQVTFIDSTEHKFGHGVMTFNSFREAASMASISRVYGGIHFRSGCDEGAKAGTAVGLNVLKVAQTRK